MNIIFAGGSHYGLGGYEALCEYFDLIYLINDNPKHILDQKREQDCIIDDFDSVDCQFVFLCGYSRLITQEQLDKKEYINVHGALLPKYRGMHSTFYAIMNGEKRLGITYHIVNKYMDAGNILAQFSFDYTNQQICEINNTIDNLVKLNSGKVLFNYMQGLIIPTPQDDSQAVYGAKRNLEDCLIDFYMEHKLLRRFFKALTPSYPFPMLRIRGKLYEVLPKTEIIDQKSYGPIGRVVFVNDKGTWLKTKEGYIVVKAVREYGNTQEFELSEIVPIGYRFQQ